MIEEKDEKKSNTMGNSKKTRQTKSLNQRLGIVCHRLHWLTAIASRGFTILVGALFAAAKSVFGTTNTR
jgi:hypothetical protein